MFKKRKGTKEKYLKLRSVATAVDRNGECYEMEREGNDWKILPITHNTMTLPLDDTVVEWYDELHNYDLIMLAIWCYENEIYLPYNFR